VGITHLTHCHTCDNIYIMTPIVKDKDWVKRADSVKPDSRRRVNLPKALVEEGIMYDIWHNKQGQIILDPQVTIPASELWLFKNKNLLALLDKGMAESVNRKLVNRGSFAKYVEDEA